ncbi:hydrolase [Colletotrichum truncatum]|uniref:Hydrolase n=1 Tax=Colletotrichum truncatum TaxID=5467 RepID=A0ACC3YWE6_COLTU|nr:hydrolase [Colletotrichum truncatum]KAF6787424.1 hydrolase [Colletotrichum truncatum]
MAEPPAVPRPLWAALLDRAVGWALGLPSEAGGYTTQPLKIPLPDGAVLACDLYRPSRDPLGTILVRGPYGRAFFFSLINARIFAARGYQVLFVSSRGTFGSTGTFEIGCEVQDGHNVVSWMRQQPWYTGTFATLGASYLGFTQWALLTNPPSDMVAAIMTVAPHDFAERMWGTGAFSLQQHIQWSDIMANQETRTIWELITAFRDPTRLDPLLKSVPLEPALRRHFGDKAPWVFSHIGQPDLDHEVWAPLRHGKALDRANIPILLIAGWFDIFLEQTIEEYQALSRRGCPVALRIGPGGHTEAQNGDTTRDTLKWLDTHLARNHQSKEIPAVRIYREGDTLQCIELPKWPPPTGHQELFLASDSRLEDQQSSKPDTSSFVFDPSNPTPTVGGALLLGKCKVDDTSLCVREDVLTFTSEPLTNSLDIFGRPSVDLVHSSDNPFCDLFVRLSVVDSQGRSRNITERYRRIEASQNGKLIDLDMADTAYRVPAGSRLRLVVAGGCSPKYSLNLGTGESIATGTVLRPAKHIIHYGGDSGSCLILPVLKKL